MCAAAPPSPVRRLVDRLDGALNPILVKDTRAWLRSRGFLALFFVVLGLVQTVTINFVLLAVDRPEVGWTLFTWLLAGLGLVLGGVVPSFIHERFSAEMTTGSTELALISRLTAAGLVRGKALTGMAAAMLFFAAAGPSLMLAYRLGGVSLPVALYAIAVLLFLSAFANLLAVLGAAVGRLSRSRLLGLPVLVLGCGMGLAVLLYSIMSAFRSGTGFREPRFWLFNILVAGAGTLVGLFLYAVATSRLSFRADNRDTLPRLCLSLLVLFLLVAGSLVGEMERLVGVAVPTGTEDAFGVAHLLALTAFGLGSLLVMNTPLRPSGRTVAAWPRSSLWSLFFYPGRGRLYAYLLLHLALFAGFSFLLADPARSSLLAATLAVLTLLAAGTLMQRGLERLLAARRGGVPLGLTTFATAFFWTVGVGLSALACEVIAGPRSSLALMKLSPLTALLDWSQRRQGGGGLLHFFGAVGLVGFAGVVMWVLGACAAAREGARLRGGTPATPEAPDG
jgi:hypothetical protein